MQRLLSGNGFFYKGNGPDGLNVAEPYIPPWVPSDLPDVLGWYDASDSSTVIITGARVSAWNSKVGVNHMIQTVDANRPVVSGSTLNGKSLLNYDGGDRWLNLTTRLTNVRTAAILCKWTDKTGDYRFIFGDSSTFDYHGDTAASDILFASFASAAVTGGNKFINNVDTASPKRYTDWTRHIFVTTGNTIIGNFVNDRGIGGRSFKGDVAEIILMSSAMTNGDRESLETFWKLKYNLA
jgi:hypothetical protein